MTEPDEAASWWVITDHAGRQQWTGDPRTIDPDALLECADGTLVVWDHIIAFIPTAIAD